MFNLFGKKELHIDAPVQGKIFDIDKVPDEVFSSKMMGDGFAVEPENDTITAPCDGVIAVLAKTKHAIAIQSKEGVQILIHIGLDTVELNGRGFTAYVEQGAGVKRGDKLITFDRDYIKNQGKPLTTMLVLTNMDEKIKKIEKNLSVSKTVLRLDIK
ncbi:PTS glucose transporter subunit IIA [Pectinatus frisingensis]|jgi:glucose-specific phosphotransferase system IIA component|nr:PTS glucose transporter subunit IIA [Pectinatus frisingensis]